MGALQFWLTYNLAELVRRKQTGVFQLQHYRATMLVLRSESAFIISHRAFVTRHNPKPAAQQVELVTMADGWPSR